MYTFRPAVRENTPLIIGLAGATKSGKTFSALRLAMGLAAGKPVAMINAEGPRGHQYAEKFKYVTCDIEAPYRPDKYTDALIAARALDPGAVIVDSASHMHDGPGGILQWHEEIIDKMSKGDDSKRDKLNFVAWVEPKASENKFIYTMLSMKCPVILCFRAKEKLKIIAGKPPIDLGWQPIAGERVAFETIFTVMLPPHSKGKPDLAISDMREPFDTMIPTDKPIDEELGKALAAWSRGGQRPTAPTVDPAKRAVLDQIQATITEYLPGQNDRDKAAKGKVLERVFGVGTWGAVTQKSIEELQKVVTKDDLTKPSKLEQACADQKAALTA